MYKSLRRIFVILFLISIGCKEISQPTKTSSFSPILLALFVEDIDTSLQWYTEKLGFEVENAIEDYPDYGLKLAFLSLNDFHLEIIEKKNSYKSSDVLRRGETYVGGVFKIGLKTNNLSHLYERLKLFEDVEFVTGIGELPENKLPIKWPTKHFLIEDPDGNYIQFFNSGEDEGIKPWLTMISVRDLESSISWYENNMNFRHFETMGEKGNRRAVMERDNYILELYEPELVFNFDENSDSTFLGFSKIAFGVNDLNRVDSILKNENSKIVMPIEESDFDWAEKAMIAKDSEGNWIQFFEFKE